MKPSVWFILLGSLRFSAVVLLLMTAIFVFDVDDKLHFLTPFAVIEAGVFLITGRLMFSALQWK